MQNKKNSNLQPNLFYGKGPKPGEFPYTSGIYPDMYQGKLWTMRQYAGFTSAEESNKRYRYLLEQGVMGLSVAFDLPTQTGYDSDHTLAAAEVGRVGVPICTLADMEVLLQDIPLAEVSISMTINSTAAILLAFLVVSAEKQGVDRKQLRGTVQNDILKEYIARGTYIFPPKPSMRIITDLFEFCSKEMPFWNTISISGYHIREAGSTAAQEIAFTLANGIAYVQAALDNGLDVNQFGKRLSFFFNCHNNFFEEVAKFRAARRMWAIIMRDRFGATEPKAMMCRFHTQTAGSTLQAQQIENNVVRTTLQAAAAVLGGTQSLHTNSRDEALALPTEKSARLALRTQQVIAYESGIPEVADPLAGSHYVEALTDELESEAAAIIEKIDTIGGAVSAIENEFQQNEIAKSAYDYQKAIDEGEKIIVGVNKFETKEVDIPETQGIDEKAVTLQLNRLQSVKQSRNSKKVKLALNALESAAEENINLIPKIIEAVKYEATLGEISDTLRGVFGEF
ncbi:MAG: methylmalonyl-CoA mutase family protein [Candidatus Marinimicrobia bacterium]|nr:methylmalonyl-CoA mutase family protein [Candidatus Neomarinimicrobiota bacterium]